jgi:hypothetical protein
VYACLSFMFPECTRKSYLSSGRNSAGNRRSCDAVSGFFTVMRPISALDNSFRLTRQKRTKLL